MESHAAMHLAPSSFEMAEGFSLVPLALGTPWQKLADHLKDTHPSAVLNFCPPRLQLDARIYEALAPSGIPYIAIHPANLPLACEVMRQMGADFVVSTRAEALALDQALHQRNMPAPSWHIIVAGSEQGLAAPQGALIDVHAYPGMPL